MNQEECNKITVELDDRTAHDLAYIARWEHCTVEELVQRYVEQSLMETALLWAWGAICNVPTYHVFPRPAGGCCFF